MGGKIPERMRAAFIRDYGGPEAIEIGELPVPHCGPDEVLIAAETLGVNHIDRFIRSGAYRTEMSWPFVIGRDVVGRVVEVGDDVSTLTVDSRVWCNSLGYDGRQGPYSEYVLAPADRVYPVPSGRDAAELVSVVHSMATAQLGLSREARVNPDHRVYIGGAGGGVGSAAVQLAHRLGAEVIASTSEKDIDWVSSLGASKVFDDRDDDLFEQIAEASDEGLDVYWDCSGRHDFGATLPLLSRGGIMIVAAGLGHTLPLPVGELYTRDASLRGFTVSNATVDDLSVAAETINTMLAGPGIKTRIGAKLPLSEAAQAYRLMDPDEPESVTGHIVVTV